MKPSSALIIVLLPAPFGPSSPTAPAANDEVTSRRAILRPYITVTVSSVTTGAISGINTLYGFHGSRDSRGSQNPRDLTRRTQRTRRLNPEGNRIFPPVLRVLRVLRG